MAIKSNFMPFYCYFITVSYFLYFNIYVGIWATELFIISLYCNSLSYIDPYLTPFLLCCGDVYCAPESPEEELEDTKISVLLY